MTNAHFKLTAVPLVCMGNWFQDPCQTPKSMDAQVSYIKWHRIMHTVFVHPQIPNHKSKILLDAKPMNVEGQLYSQLRYSMQLLQIQNSSNSE